jgi:hypothetical protein
LKNRLIPDHIRDSMIKMHGYCDEGRCTGKSLGIALKLIGEAISNPGVPMYIYDHHRHVASHRRLAQFMESIIETLDLKFLEFRTNGKDITLTYTLFKE